MRQAAVQVRRQQVSRAVSMSAPVGGLNARDSLAQMKPEDAVILDNWVCTPYKVQLRSGSASWSTGITGTVETLAEYQSGSASKFFAAAGTAIYEVTATGAVGAAVQSGLSNARFQWTNIATSGGQFLYMVNGVDKPRLYDGTNWVSVDAASTPAITGVTTTLLATVTLHKFRPWFIETGTLKAWYLPVSSVGGAAASFDLSSLFPSGGSLLAIGTWTIDGGYGMDDQLVFITTQGEVAVYRGTDPASATTWALVGVYSIGTPIGRNCLSKYMGDLLIICRDGLLPMSQALITSRTQNRIALTDKIQALVALDTVNYASVYGWSVTFLPSQNLLILNVPTSSSTAKQYVMNTISGAWSTFSGWNANCWILWNDEIYFGTSTKVIHAWTGTADSGSNINGDALQAFSSFGGESQLKRFVEARPIVSFDNPPGVLIGLNVDFDVTAPSGTPTFSANTQATWDTAVWDTALWGGSEGIRRDWQAVGSIGYWGAMHIKSASNGTHMSWFATDVVMEEGSVM